MEHPFMVAVAAGLAVRGIASLRYQFPSMEHQIKRPDPPQVAQATVRAVVTRALDLLPNVPLIAGGKSFGGRMTSQAQAKVPLPGVRGLVFFGFPLHPVGRPSQDRAQHLFQVQIPMLFLQGTRDRLASLDETRLTPLTSKGTGPQCGIKNIRCSQILCAVAFAAEQKRPRTDSRIQHTWTGL